jgi:hypothetical protein
MELALRRRLEGVAEIRISQERQTADVSFAPGGHAFSAREFRAAVGEADVEVVRFEIDACGRVELVGDTTWFSAGPNRFSLNSLSPGIAGDHCVTAALDDGASPGRLEYLREWHGSASSRR